MERKAFEALDAEKQGVLDWANREDAERGDVAETLSFLALRFCAQGD